MTVEPKTGRPVRRRKFYPLEPMLAVGLAVYGIYGVIVDDLAIPFFHSTGKPGVGSKKIEMLHFHGPQAWLLFAAMMCIALGLAIRIVGKYADGPRRRVGSSWSNGLLGAGFCVAMVMILARGFHLIG
ncbi:hypothetical protein [Pseudorhodobacter sp.]|uniref:hypothetical protein n=1 Tax=Pseudorhodobacter sp. TaxID=1934400 RepID=UPI0026487FAA|nr:hypothetical protein [Pseudorhodobacter sp.]MDN5789199.1 hypothetical protein [Pseudorhodobacter sp.]